MSDNKTNNVMDQMTPAEEMALMVEGLYRSVNSDLQKMKKELLNEMKFTAAQSSSMYDSIQKDTASAADSAAKSVDSITNEMKYVYQQNQAIYEDVSAKLNERIDALEEKLAVLEEIEQQLKLLNNKGDETDYDTVSEMVKDKVVDSIPVYEELDYEKLSESVSEKAEAAFAEQNQQVLSAVAAIPVAENVDYSRIVEEVGDRVLEILREQKDAEESIVEEAEEPAEVAAEVDYDRIIYGSAEKVVESLPYQDKVDYDRIERMIANSSATDAVNPETIAELVVEKMGKEDDFAYEVVIDGENVDKIVEGISEGFDFETLSDKIAEKVKVPEEVLPELDYDKLSDLVASKVAVPEPSMEIDYERLADLVASKLAAPDVDYDRLAEAVVAKMSEKEV
ncbi:MAG: hypothetical protein IJV80_04860, partial [Clostridia bacterium]|nr:hypothetical protein [Clostridia bacterium]